MISSSTVHNVFRQSRVPSWDYLEKIVIALHGDAEEFLDLWQAAWQVDKAAETPQVSLQVHRGASPAIRASGSGRMKFRAVTPTSPAG